jgi:tight adherence protein C
VEVLLTQVLAFLAVVMLVMSITALVNGAKPEAVDAARPALFQLFNREIQGLGRTCEPALARAFPVQAKRVQNDLIAAALSGHVTPVDIRGLQVLLAVMLGLGGAISVLVTTLNGAGATLALATLGLIGFIYPTLWLGRKAQDRKTSMSKTLPYALDLLTVAMQAGQDFGAAVRNLVNEGPRGPLFQEFAMMLREVELGKSRVEAMRAMAARIQVDEFQSVVTAVVQSTEMGASVTAALKLQAEELRRSRFHKAERKAARAPSIMMIPVAIFILPSVFIIIFTPVIMRVMGVLHSAR